MIRSFADRDTERLWRRERVASIDPKVQKAAIWKLKMLDAAPTLDTLRVPPGNRLEALNGDREGQFSIRVNDQWRLCFIWNHGGVEDVELVDYH
ncbi:type II toxin-antitoxin system RelE/ParE family toxin [Corynebacterium halotolerans]|uniref:Plasmid maintenance system killer protein n=1 Tax=Corynebacterium halotolerans YIM 70093 = DSM 44683 TaxID=1121362 RepID=M1NR97_9CORY|nr:type II toxin-antitoxin system RelE/ParE family toxin [Corynebacterium halotolerans]AGF72022.1 hypothetical protein A605_05080 [Corynebacterium halotolerans YIM 70093 = DSM 44683]